MEKTVAEFDGANTAVARLAHLSAHWASCPQSRLLESQCCPCGQQSSDMLCSECCRAAESRAPAAARGGMARAAARIAMNKVLKTLIDGDYRRNSGLVKSRLGEASELTFRI